MSQFAIALEALGADSVEINQLRNIAWYPARYPCILVWGSGTTAVERCVKKGWVRVVRKYPAGKNCEEWMCECTPAGYKVLAAAQLAKYHDQQNGLMP